MSLSVYAQFKIQSINKKVTMTYLIQCDLHVKMKVHREGAWVQEREIDWGDLVSEMRTVGLVFFLAA
jgi:hypothetical protein